MVGEQKQKGHSIVRFGPFCFKIILKFFFGLLILTGCGYRMGQGELSSLYQTISVPYVEGDTDGAITSVLIKELVSRTPLEYQREGGALLLCVKIIDLRDENIGFRYYRKKKGHLTHSIIPTETRITAAAEIMLKESGSGEVLVGPVTIEANVDFDHDFYFSPDGNNVVSLGQLSDYDAAYDAVQRPLNQCLARKIIDYMIESW